MERAVYVVLALTLNVPPATTSEEIDDILNETDFKIENCPILKGFYVAEHQFPYSEE